MIRAAHEEIIHLRCQLTLSEVSPLSACGDHSGVQTDVVLKLRMLHLAGNRNSTDCQIEGSLSKGDLRAHPHSNTFLPTRPHLLIVPFPLGAILCQPQHTQPLPPYPSNDMLLFAPRTNLLLYVIITHFCRVHFSCGCCSIGLL